MAASVSRYEAIRSGSNRTRSRRGVRPFLARNSGRSSKSADGRSVRTTDPDAMRREGLVRARTDRVGERGLRNRSLGVSLATDLGPAFPPTVAQVRFEPPNPCVAPRPNGPDAHKTCRKRDVGTSTLSMQAFRSTIWSFERFPVRWRICGGVDCAETASRSSSGNYACLRSAGIVARPIVTRCDQPGR